MRRNQPARQHTASHLPAPHGKDDRIVAVVRGTVKSRDAARATHSLEFFSVDVWMDGDGMGQYYQDPEYGSGFQELFAGEPTTSVWTHPPGE